MSKDITDILDAGNLGNVIVVSHDWCVISVIVPSRFVMLITLRAGARNLPPAS